MIHRPLAMVKTGVNLLRHRGRPYRALEIGPGPQRIDGFETLNIVAGSNVDYVWDASRRLPFGEATFDLIYASHILEHIPWYHTEWVLRQWVRVLKPAGVLEVWVPDGLKICQTLVQYENTGDDRTSEDGWYKFNDEKDPCKWAAGRLFTYGDGSGAPNNPNWHRAVFTPRYLAAVLAKVGLRDVRAMDRTEVRGYDHGWINLGMRGVKA